MTSSTASRDADLALTGSGQLVLGVLTGQVDLALARQLGLEVRGSTAVLERLRYLGPPARGLDRHTPKETSA